VKWLAILLTVTVCRDGVGKWQSLSGQKLVVKKPPLPKPRGLCFAGQIWRQLTQSSTGRCSSVTGGAANLAHTVFLSIGELVEYHVEPRLAQFHRQIPHRRAMRVALLSVTEEYGGHAC
jgi:hypothetical protein